MKDILVFLNFVNVRTHLIIVGVEEVIAQKIVFSRYKCVGLVGLIWGGVEILIEMWI